MRVASRRDAFTIMTTSSASIWWCLSTYQEEIITPRKEWGPAEINFSLLYEAQMSDFSTEVKILVAMFVLSCILHYSLKTIRYSNCKFLDIQTVYYVLFM
jgi:hypothetical protein